MKRVLLLCWLACNCCLLVACGAKNQNGNTASANAASGNSQVANNNAPAAKPDAVFAREAVEGLLEGDPAVADAFDWEHLKVPGADAGSAYRELPDDENRAGFREGFIKKFAESFKKSGAKVSDLKNWRELPKDGETSIVGVDTTTGQTMRIVVVRRDGRQKISELSIE